MTKLYPYQIEGVRLLKHFGGRALLADEMGLGKSIQSLAFAVQNRVRLTVVVCPAVLKYQWGLQAAEHYNLRAEILEGTKPPPNRMVRPQKLIVLNYDILGAWLPYLRELRPELVILDEAVAIKNPQALRTKRVRKLCRRVPFVLALSGAPINNRPAEFFPVCNLLWPDEFPSWWPFAHKYCGPQRKPWGWEFKGATKIPELNRKLKRLGMIRRLKADVLPDLPPKTRVVTPVALSDARTYRTAQNDFGTWLRANWASTRADNAARAYRLTQFGELKRLAARLKLPAIFDWIENFLAEGEKLIVYGIHKRIVRQIHERFPNSVLVNGEVTGRARQRAVEEFQKQKRCRLFVANIDAAGMGLNLQFCRHVAVVELPWTPGQCRQAEDRVHRIGQTEKTWIHYLIANDTIEVKLCNLLQQKQAVLSDVLDGGRGDSLDILDRLTKSLMEKSK